MAEPQSVLDLAGACVAAVQNAVGVELDFTQDTLPLLDHYASIATGPRDEILGLVAPMCGAYFGEVVRHHVGAARWHAPDDDFTLWRLEFETCFLYFNPVGVALEALTGREAEGWGATLRVLDRDRAAMQAALELYGDVDEKDFFRFSVRFEAIEQVYQRLGQRAVEHDGPKVLYPHAVYEAAVADAERGRTGEPPN